MVSAVLAIALVGGSVAGGPATAGSGEEGPSELSHIYLDQLETTLTAAAKASTPRRQIRHINTIYETWDKFIFSIFKSNAEPTGQSLFGCGYGASWHTTMNLANVDAFLEMAARRSLRRENLRTGLSWAEILAKKLESCRGADEAKAIAMEILQTTQSLVDDETAGGLDDEELASGTQRVADLKETMLGRERLYSCDVLPIYRLLTKIRKAGWRAYIGRTTAGRKVQVLIALRATRNLIVLWKRAPCGGKCADGRDNDGDGARDTGDSGCRTGAGGAYEPLDESEEDYDPELDCTRLEAGKPVSSFIRQPNSGSTMNRHSLRNITDGQVVIERASDAADFSSGGPIPVGTAVCGPGTSATVEWTRAGLVMHWVVKVSKDDPNVAPTEKVIIVAADTR